MEEKPLTAKCAKDSQRSPRKGQLKLGRYARLDSRGGFPHMILFCYRDGLADVAV
jgi:hypothetical protein